jgi:hypothetical protein
VNDAAAAIGQPSPVPHLRRRQHIRLVAAWLQLDEKQVELRNAAQTEPNVSRF